MQRVGCCAQGVRRAAAAAAAAAGADGAQPAPILANSRTAARALDAERAERVRAKAARKRKREVRHAFTHASRFAVLTPFCRNFRSCALLAMRRRSLAAWTPRSTRTSARW